MQMRGVVAEAPQLWKLPFHSHKALPGGGGCSRRGCRILAHQLAGKPGGTNVRQLLKSSRGGGGGEGGLQPSCQALDLEYPISPTLTVKLQPWVCER